MALAAFLLALFGAPGLYPDEMPLIPGAHDFRRNALQSYWMLNDNPIPRSLSILVVYRLQIDEVRREADHDRRLPEWRNRRARLTARGPFGIVLSRFQLSCAGTTIERL